jgi:hypothetical protein
VSVRVTGIEEVLDPWLERVSDQSKRAAVIAKVIWASEHFDELFAQQAPIGDNPLFRWIDIPEVEVTIRVFLPYPNRGINLISIFDLDKDE